jgi:hypothetical protein
MPMAVNPNAGMQRNAIASAIMNKGFGTNYATPFAGPQITPGMSGVVPQTYNPALGASSGADLSRSGVPAPPATLPQQPQGWDFQAGITDASTMPNTFDWGGGTGSIATTPTPGGAPAAQAGGAMMGQIDAGTGSSNNVNLPESIRASFNNPQDAPPTQLPLAAPTASSWTPGQTGLANMPGMDSGNWGGSTGMIGTRPSGGMGVPNTSIMGGLFGSRGGV